MIMDPLAESNWLRRLILFVHLDSYESIDKFNESDFDDSIIDRAIGNLIKEEVPSKPSDDFVERIMEKIREIIKEEESGQTEDEVY